MLLWTYHFEDLILLTVSSASIYLSWIDNPIVRQFAITLVYTLPCVNTRSQHRVTSIWPHNRYSYNNNSWLDGYVLYRFLSICIVAIYTGRLQRNKWNCRYNNTHIICIIIYIYLFIYLAVSTVLTENAIS